MRFKIHYDFGEIQTPGLRCSFRKDIRTTLSYSVSPDWNLKPRPLLFVYEGYTTELRR